MKNFQKAVKLAEEKNLLDFKELIKEELNEKVTGLFVEGPQDDEDANDDDQEEFDFDLSDFDVDGLDEEALAYIVENITEEDYEQLDELSKELLGRYLKKANKEYKNITNSTDVHPKEYMGRSSRMTKRVYGINTAMDKRAGRKSDGSYSSFTSKKK